MARRLVLTLPPEYLGLCREYGLDPAALLRGFIADLCEIPDWADDPRPDGYTSHGADERDLAWAWFERCGYGQRMEDERREE
ncbi:hypothetical protein IC757_11025 [Wenzhouxiangella sp. AB-CW3]|uniref:hypothetical protein n=1 Tax=Wenzhouxiangella sp. AB-CW3 TaxID=2771012 RepID=UPI00168B3A4F|nr:hypothetical protein [Wenzhouxiangella sp. AB-CW3]QOC21573.1 hypothetical protein IC757_11025 [Wenzhouxiangella sp. AB-CW3]